MSNSPATIALAFDVRFVFTQDTIDKFVQTVEQKGYKILDVPKFVEKYIRTWTTNNGTLELIWDDHYYGGGCGLGDVMDDEDEGTLYEQTDDY